MKMAYLDKLKEIIAIELLFKDIPIDLVISSLEHRARMFQKTSPYRKSEPEIRFRFDVIDGGKVKNLLLIVFTTGLESVDKTVVIDVLAVVISQ